MQFLYRLKDVQELVILKPQQIQLLTHSTDPLQLSQSALLISTQIYVLFYEQAKRDLKQFSQKASRLLVLLNGQMQDAWHCRLQLLSEDKLDIQEQLRLNHLSSLNSKKSSFPFHYRLKMYENLNLSDLQKFEHQKKYFFSYLKIHPRNYHFWNFRLKFLRSLKSDLKSQEIGLTLQHLQSNIGNRTAANHLLNLLAVQQFPQFLQLVRSIIAKWQSLYTTQESQLHLKSLRWLQSSLNKLNDQFE